MRHENLRMMKKRILIRPFSDHHYSHHAQELKMISRSHEQAYFTAARAQDMQIKDRKEMLSNSMSLVFNACRFLS